jgi:hypothetical protein
MSPDELAVLDDFMKFCGLCSCTDPKARDIRAFGALNEVSAQNMLNLEKAFNRLGIGSDFSRIIENVAWDIHHKEDFSIIPNKCNHECTYKFSVPEKEFPEDWKKTISALRSKKIPAPSILKRMIQRLGAFRFSAMSAGLEADLSSTKALRAFYIDLRTRSSEKNDGEPRWAYLRSAFEELRRFAVAHGYDGAVVDLLQSKEKELTALEQKQTPQKMAKAISVPDAGELLVKAEGLLNMANKADLPQLRHTYRNRSAAIAIGIAIPARPIDVYQKHIFNEGIFFDENTGCYRFKYLPSKAKSGAQLSIELAPYWNQFIDALILQDQHPSYLWEIRRKVLKDRRPLYVLYTGRQCGYSWYSNAWRAVVGTGGHIARTKIYDSMANLGEFGIQYSRAVCHHRSQTISQKYRSEISIQRSYQAAADAIVQSSGSMHEDISDLLI